MNNIIIDIGANHGEFAFEIAKRNPDVRVLAFEPEPHLFAMLKKADLKNVTPFDVAITSKQGIADFNVSHIGDWGVSSLLNFNQENIKNDCYWRHRADLKSFDEKIQVRTDTLENILSKENFDEVSFIKVDTQGFDLIALKSAGRYLKKIQAGMIEAVSTPDKSLYAGDECDLYHALNFFHSNNFKVYRIKPNDHACNEMNIYFCRTDISAEQIEHDCHLKNLHIYDGKDYWFFPSNKYPTTIVPFSPDIHEVKQCSPRSHINEEKVKNASFLSALDRQRCRFLSHITFGKTKEHYRKKYKDYFKTQQDCVNLLTINNIVVDETGVPFSKPDLIVNIQGENNKIVIDKSTHFHNGNKLIISINGSNCKVCIGRENIILGTNRITMGGDKNHRVNNVKVTVGNKNRFSNFRFSTVNSNSTLTIGNNCMFSVRVDLHNTDNHPIYDLNNSSNIINKVSDMKIGNSVWICEDVTILKNVSIPDGCIVGKFAVVSDQNLTKCNCVIAGNPAKVVKENIMWKTYDPAYISNLREDR